MTLDILDRMVKHTVDECIALLYAISANDIYFVHWFGRCLAYNRKYCSSVLFVLSV